jgi:hypothetical protein
MGAPPTAGAQRDRLNPLDLIPPTVESLVYIADVGEAIEALGASPAGRIAADRTAATLLAPFHERFAAEGLDLIEALTQPDRGLLESMDGALALARFGSSSAPGAAPVSTLLVFHHRSDAAALVELLAPKPARGVRVNRIPARMDGRSFTRIQIVREVEGAIRRDSSSETRRALPPGLARSPLVMSQKTEEIQVYADARIAIVASAEGGALRQAMTRLDTLGRGVPSLSDSMRRRGAIAARAARPDVELYLDLSRAVGRPAATLDASLLGAGADPDRLGLDQVQSVSIGLSFFEDRIEAEARAYAPPPHRGLGRILFMGEPFSALDAGAADSLPADALGYWTLRADLPGVWAQARTALREGAPSLDGLIDLYLQTFGPQGGAPFESDVLGALGAKWITYWRRAPEGDPTRAPEASTAIEVRDAARLRAGLARWLAALSEAMGLQFDERAEDDRVFFHLRGAEIGQGAMVDLRPLAHFCLTDRWLLVGPRLEHLTAFADRARDSRGASLADAAGGALARARDDMPADRFFEAYLPRESIGAFLTSTPASLFGDLASAAGVHLLAPTGAVLSPATGLGPAAITIAAEVDVLKARVIIYAAERPDDD